MLGPYQDEPHPVGAQWGRGTGWPWAGCEVDPGKLGEGEPRRPGARPRVGNDDHSLLSTGCHTHPL